MDKTVIVDTEINNIISGTERFFGNAVTKEMAFNYLTLWYFYLCNEMKYKYNDISLENVDYRQLQPYITDGANDGGIDYVYFDDDSTPKVVVVQSKYKNNGESIDYNTIISELNKMSDTINNFVKCNSGGYNSNLQRELQNALDSLPDSQSTNVEYIIFTNSDLDVEKVMRKIERSENPSLTRESVTIYKYCDIESKIITELEEIPTVSEAKIKIDRAKNMLTYRTDKVWGIMVNVSSHSIKKLFNKYKDSGLFDLNIRRFIKNKLVDKGINDSLQKAREDFWFLNNGIIIACKNFDPDGDTVNLWDFSIVNGGQTTHLIGSDTSSDEEFFLPCKIICQNPNIDNKDDNQTFFTRIAEATNSQKPIYQRDIKSNSPEMRRLQRWLKQDKVFLEIKRGVKLSSSEKKQYDHFVKNDELGQLILSFIHQRPGTARSNKKELFETPALYGKIYMHSYEKDECKKKCIIDIVKINTLYETIAKDLAESNSLEDEEKVVLKNGKQIIFAVLGLLYRWTNNDYLPEDAITNKGSVVDNDFMYSSIISNYDRDDLYDCMYELIVWIIQQITRPYQNALETNKASSVSNYFKKDGTYYNEIIPALAKEYMRNTRSGKKSVIDDYVLVLKRK